MNINNNLSRKYIENILKFKQISRFYVIFAIFLPILAVAQPRHGRYVAYIERYKAIALQHEREFGIPASITLAQGLLESNAGSSYLATAGNNHFGIKSYNWRGESVEWDDSLQHIKYRKYGAPEDSFLDHARFLKGPRYTPLYQFDVTDYRGWAQGLRNCGYAEDPSYPDKLIRIIEQYQLYTLNGGTRQMPESDCIKQQQEQLQRSHESLADKDRDIEQRSYRTARQGRVPSSADND